jgi:hypothetical protein
MAALTRCNAMKAATAAAIARAFCGQPTGMTRNASTPTSGSTLSVLIRPKAAPDNS